MAHGIPNPVRTSGICLIERVHVCGVLYPSIFLYRKLYRNYRSPSVRYPLRRLHYNAPNINIHAHMTHSRLLVTLPCSDLKSCGSQGRVGSTPTTRTKSTVPESSPTFDYMILSKKTGFPKGICNRDGVFHVDLCIDEVRRTGTAGSRSCGRPQNL